MKQQDKKLSLTSKKFIRFFLLQIFLFSLLLFLIISVSLNAQYIIKLDEFIFKIFGVIKNKFINNIMLFITFLGESYTIVILLIFLLLFNFKKISFPLLSLTSISAIINYCLKNLIQRTRPIGEFVNNLIFKYDFPTSYSFPSGHSQTSLVFYFVLGYLLLDNYYKGKHKKFYLTIITLIPILIMLSRIILGVHYFTDVLVGAIIGIIIITNYLYLKTFANAK